VEVLGRRWGTEDDAIRQQIGISLQETKLSDKLSVRETLTLFRSFYKNGLEPDQAIQQVGLTDKATAWVGKLSGGQRQRLAVACALIGDPQLLMLDEPTTGLDPQIRLEIHGLIEEMKAERRTVLLTTHYIEEAERLCDRVAIMDEGKIIAIGTPRELQQKSRSQSCIQITCGQDFNGHALPDWPDAVSSMIEDDGRSLTVHSNRPARTLVEIIKWLDQQGMQLEDVHLKRPTLEDVFVELTGKKLRD